MRQIQRKNCKERNIVKTELVGKDKISVMDLHDMFDLSRVHTYAKSPCITVQIIDNRKIVKLSLR